MATSSLSTVRTSSSRASVKRLKGDVLLLAPWIRTTANGPLPPSGATTSSSANLRCTSHWKPARSRVFAVLLVHQRRRSDAMSKLPVTTAYLRRATSGSSGASTFARSALARVLANRSSDQLWIAANKTSAMSSSVPSKSRIAMLVSSSICETRDCSRLKTNRTGAGSGIGPGLMINRTSPDSRNSRSALSVERKSSSGAYRKTPIYSREPAWRSEPWIGRPLSRLSQANLGSCAAPIIVGSVRLARGCTRAALRIFIFR